MEFNDLIGKVIEREGGYVNHKDDRGGATNMGITQRSFSAWLSKHAKPDRDVRTTTLPEAERFYFEEYWAPAKCPEIPAAVRNIHFDAAVNHGVTRAIKMLQGAAVATPDGAFGPATLRAVSAINQDLLLMRYVATRYRFYGQIIQRDRSQLVFIAGWMRRMEEFA